MVLYHEQVFWENLLWVNESDSLIKLRKMKQNKNIRIFGVNQNACFWVDFRSVVDSIQPLKSCLGIEELIFFINYFYDLQLGVHNLRGKNL